ncbi:MAG: LacI family DNA-binding transcriptional regulator [Cellulosilyticaceae bacterium]
MNEKKMVTAKDIAKVCGISQATVSYVINNKEGKKISDKTRELILETAKTLDYIPNSSARTMRTSRALSIGVVSGRNCINMGFNHVLRGVKREADQRGYSITLLNDDEISDRRQCDYVTYFRANKIDAILFIFYEMSDETLEVLHQYNIPYLMINENGVWGKEITVKKVFGETVSECIKLCQSNGWKRIRFFSITHGGNVRSYKYNLFKEALNKFFPQAELKRVFCEGNNTEILGQLEEYMRHEKFDIAITPHQRLGLLTQSAILKKNFELPQVIKHICLGDSKVFRDMYPTVTSISIPLEEMGTYGAQALVRMIEGKEIEEKEFECILEYGMSTH